MTVALQWVALTGVPAAAAGLSSSGSASAATEPAEQQARMRFEAMDLNNDGMISRSEWQGSAQSFRVHDWNGDGVLSGNEVRIGGRRDQEDDVNLDPVDVPDGASEFEYLDRNNNNRIERREWNGSAATFNQLDRNGDNVLSHAEVLGNQANNRLGNTFANLDYDNDGVISLNEWSGTRASFNRLDLNNDGVLTRREYANLSEGGTTASAQTVRVPGTERWVDTGLFVRAGDVVAIRANGSMQLSDNPNDLATPAGSQTGRTAANAPIPSGSAGALLMRIGNSAPILVGDRGAIEAPATGRVLLGVNDDHLPDNIGEYRVAVNVRGQ